MPCCGNRPHRLIDQTAVYRQIRDNNVSFDILLDIILYLRCNPIHSVDIFDRPCLRAAAERTAAHWDQAAGLLHFHQNYLQSHSATWYV